jgi:hypothetical protein
MVDSAAQQTMYECHRLRNLPMVNLNAGPGNFLSGASGFWRSGAKFGLLSPNRTYYDALGKTRRSCAAAGLSYYTRPTFNSRHAQCCPTPSHRHLILPLSESAASRTCLPPARLCIKFDRKAASVFAQYRFTTVISYVSDLH